MVLDPFCGCGTTIYAAEKLGRQWIGIDVTYLAINLIKRRLEDAFGEEITATTSRKVSPPISRARGDSLNSTSFNSSIGRCLSSTRGHCAKGRAKARTAALMVCSTTTKQREKIF